MIKILNPFLVKLQVRWLTLIVSRPCFPNHLTDHLFVQKFQEPTSWGSFTNPSALYRNLLTEFFDPLLDIRILLASNPFPVPGLWNFIPCFLHFFGNRNCQEQDDHDVPLPEFHLANYGNLLRT